MSQSSKKAVAFFLFVLLALSTAPSARAEASESEKSITGFFKRLFNYPVKATQETGKMTGNALSNTGEKVISKTGENTQAIVSGDLSKTGNLVVDPVVGAAQNTGQAVSETVQIPVKAAEEDVTAAATTTQQ